MKILRLPDDSHEMPSLVFSKKYKQKKNQNVVCCSCDKLFKDQNIIWKP